MDLQERKSKDKKELRKNTTDVECIGIWSVRGVGDSFSKIVLVMVPIFGYITDKIYFGKTLYTGKVVVDSLDMY